MEDTVKETVATVASSIQATMKEFREELQRAKSQQQSLTITSLATRFESFQNFVLATLNTLQRQVELLSHENDTLEMRGRRNILLVHGLQEKNNEDATSSVLQLCSEELKVSAVSDLVISRCHRMGRIAGDKPRPLLVEFNNIRIRDKVWSSKKSLKGSGVTLSEFLTKPRHAVFKAARQQLGVTKCWTREGVIFALGPDGARHRISTVAEVEKLAAEYSKGEAGAGVSGVSVPKMRQASQPTKSLRPRAAKK